MIIKKLKALLRRANNKIIQHKRNSYIKHLRKNNKNLSPSIIASNCNGTFIQHDLGLKFNSPFINLWIKPKDFILLLKDFDSYINAELIEVFEDNITYPIGQLKDITLYFQHYKSFEEAKKKWNERKQRINYDNLFVLFTDRDGCSEDILQEFDKLNYPNKVVFVNKEYPNIKSAFYIRGFENESSVGICSDFMPNKSWKRYLDQFNYLAWLNSK
ncbi:MAG: DUF1919 domain-containing protein [Eubacterium sp.]|nr:DUF1919 domain-containing protein [Eubacterium sp.]